MAKLDKVLEEIRQSETVIDGLAVQNRELKAALEDARRQMAENDLDTAKIDEAVALLDKQQETGYAALRENTDGEFGESTN